MLTILFDGIAYGMLLFILAVGLAVTMGLMNFINLAHGAFAMAGGYITVLLMQRLGVPFLVCLPLAFIGAALLGAVLRAHAVPPAVPQAAPGPGAVLDRPDVHGGGGDRLLHRLDPADHPVARLFLRGPHRDRQRRLDTGHGALPRSSSSPSAPRSPSACSTCSRSTRFGSRLRASVDDQRVAAGLGINVNVVFLSTFAFGSGLAGLGGALGAEVLGLDPTFPLKFMIYFLIVVAVGGTSSITGPLLAALLLGHRRRGRQVLHPQDGRVHRLQPDDRDPDLAPAGPVRAPGRQADEQCIRRAAIAVVQPRAGGRGRRCCGWRPSRLRCCCPAMRCIVNEIAIVALFAISLDLVLGYTGIVSLGHAAFFGMGAYSAALFAKHVMPDPLVGLVVGVAAATVLGAHLQRDHPARQRPDAADGDARRRL